jgi:hypothetical protein
LAILVTIHILGAIEAIQDQFGYLPIGRKRNLHLANPLDRNFPDRNRHFIARRKNFAAALADQKLVKVD